MTDTITETYMERDARKFRENLHMIAESYRPAAEELRAFNAPVYAHLAGEHGSIFILGAELRTNDDQMFADYYQEEVRERWDREDVPIAERKIINAQSIREDVHVVLRKHGLRAEWINPGQVGIYAD